MPLGKAACGPRFGGHACQEEEQGHVEGVENATIHDGVGIRRRVAYYHEENGDGLSDVK